MPVTALCLYGSTSFLSSASHTCQKGLTCSFWIHTQVFVSSCPSGLSLGHSGVKWVGICFRTSCWGFYHFPALCTLFSHLPLFPSVSALFIPFHFLVLMFHMLSCFTRKGSVQSPCIPLFGQLRVTDRVVADEPQSRVAGPCCPCNGC